MPDLGTFDTYVTIDDWLKEGDPHWEKAVANLGNPLLLLSHEGFFGRAEAMLLTHPAWRCLYYDALAAVFVPRSQSVSPTDFPTVDFAARHFREPARPSIPKGRRAANLEQRALYNLAAALPSSPENTWRLRIPVLLCALDRAAVALQEDPNQFDVWLLLGSSYLHLNPQQEQAAVHTPEMPWNVERGIWWAQGTFCLRRAVELKPTFATAWRTLARIYSQRRMIEPELAAAGQWLQLDPTVQPRQRAKLELQRQFLIGKNRPLTAIEQIEPLVQRQSAHGQSSWDWSLAERAAGLSMHLGQPALAREIWQRARDCPSAALRLCRLASTYWVERDFAAAVNHYQQAQDKDPQLAEACWGLAMLHTQLGEADPALTACQRGLRLSLNEQQRSDLEALQRLLLPYASHP
jgi:tetratricopeptide (TPR) repeat protein